MLNEKINNIKLLYELYPIFKRVDENNQGIIAEKAHFKTLNADEYISSVEGACQGILFVLKGNLNISRINSNGDETKLYNLTDGQVCHEALSCLLEYKTLNIIGSAIQKSTVCIIPIEIVNKYLIKNSEFLTYMYKDIYEKFSIIIEKREDKNHKSLEERIIEYLLKKNSRIIYSTHKDIAYEIDSKREVVSRKLKELEKAGYIKLQRGKIILLKKFDNI